MDGSLAQSRAMQILDVLSQKRTPASLSIVSIDENISYFIAQDSTIKAWLARIGVSFQGDIAASDRLWLRKEIARRAKEVIK